MNKNALWIILTLVLISSLYGCAKENPQSTPAPSATSAPSQQGALPPVDYSIPNRPVKGSGIATDGESLFLITDDDCGIIFSNTDGTDMKLIKEEKSLPFGVYYDISYCNGWLYYFSEDGIYRIRPNGESNTRLFKDDIIVPNDKEEGEISKAVCSVVEDGLLYYLYYDIEHDELDLFSNDGKERQLIIEDIPFIDGGPSPKYLLYNENIYYINDKGLLIKHNIQEKRSETCIYIGATNFYAINDGMLYYMSTDGQHNICAYDLLTKQKQRFPITVDGYIESVAQFHNYLIFFSYIDLDNYYIVTGLDINTQKTYKLGKIEDTCNLSICTTKDCVFIRDLNSVYRLYFKDGSAIIEPLENVGDILLNTEGYNPRN